jgi:hypothetical protein
LSVPRPCQSNNRPHPDFRVDAAGRLLPRPLWSIVKHRALPVSAAARVPPRGLSTFGQLWRHLILREPHGHPTDFFDQADGCLDRSFTPSRSPHSSGHHGRHLTADGASPVGSTPELTSTRSPLAPRCSPTHPTTPQPSVWPAIVEPSDRPRAALERQPR